MPASSIVRDGAGAAFAGLLTVAFALAPSPSLAAPPAGDTSGAAPGDAPDEAEPEGDPETDRETPDEDDELQPTVTEVERGPAPSGGGVAGAIVDPDDPNATRAQSDLEGESLDDDVNGVPERLPKLQAAGWWTTFTAVALATTGGILAGVAESRQDQAERMAYTFDLETGRNSLYAEVADDYETLLRQGETFQWMARGFVIAGGVTLIAGITLFAVEGVRRRRAERSATPATGARLRLEPGPGGLSLRF